MLFSFHQTFRRMYGVLVENWLLDWLIIGCWVWMVVCLDWLFGLAIMCVFYQLKKSSRSGTFQKKEGRLIMLNWTLGFEGEDEKANIGLCRFAFTSSYWWNERWSYKWWNCLVNWRLGWYLICGKCIKVLKEQGWEECNWV